MNNNENENVGLRFLQLFCPLHLYEEIEGDLLHRFQKDALRLGRRRAHWRLFWAACRFFRPEIILRNRLSFKLSAANMLFTHLRFSMRIFLREKFFSVLNIVGLAL